MNPLSVDVTTMSTKGQIVIPQSLRKKMGLKENTSFLVATDGENLLLKPLGAPPPEEFQLLVRESREVAYEARLTPLDLKKAIRRTREKTKRRP